MQIVVGKDQRKVDEERARHSFSVPTDSVWSIARVRELVLSARSGSRDCCRIPDLDRVIPEFAIPRMITCER